MSFKESEHPRDADGKFTDGASSGGEKSLEEIAKDIFPHLTEERKLVKIDLQFFTEKETDLPKQESASIKRSIRKLRRRILEHKEKVEHPEQHSVDWEELSEKRRQKRLEYWQTEIKEFEKSIQRRIDELKKRGENTDE